MVTTIATATSAHPQAPLIERGWTFRQRIAWWAKFTLAVAAAVVTLAGAARALGVTVDLETRSEARTQHDELEAKIKAELRGEQAAAIERVERAIDKLGDRFDRALERRGH